MTFLSKRLNQFSELIEKTNFKINGNETSFDEAKAEIYTIFEESIDDKKKVFVIGNGGSAGIASHHVVDLINVLKVSAFTISDSNLITCMGNDYGYQSVFSRPLECLANPADVLIAISSSGNSDNILRACNMMKKKGGKVITLSGFASENPLRTLGDINIWTPENDYGLVESAHFFILHTLIDGWQKKINFEKLEATNLNVL